MAYFAQIDSKNRVIQVVAVANEVITDPDSAEVEQRGKDLLKAHGKGEWIKTSFNGKVRKNFAGIGFTYDSARDAFLPPHPFPSWLLNEETCQWKAPIAQPVEGLHAWNEAAGAWEKL